MPPSIEVTRELLADWPLPTGGESKYDRGQVVVVGGSRRSPGAAILSGVSSLRVGAGRLTLAVAESVSTSVAVALPECGVVGLGESRDGHIRGDSLDDAARDLGAADAVLVGPGLADRDHTSELVRAAGTVMPDEATLILDAFALSAVADDQHLLRDFGGSLVMTPNQHEAELLLAHPLTSDGSDAREIAARYGAVVTLSNTIAEPSGTTWVVREGNSGLGTSGSGDVLAGAIAGLCARGASPQQATVWATWAHHAAGDRLAARVGPVGYLPTEVANELPRCLDTFS